MRSRGKTPKEIEDSQRRVHLNKSIKKDPKSSNAKIKWSPNDHRFMWKKDGVKTEVTMTQYFFDRYGIKLVSQAILHCFDVKPLVSHDCLYLG
jgi:hypothetical protein